MNRQLQVSVDCGSATCARHPGAFCRFLGFIDFGTVPVCRLFPSGERSYSYLMEVDGWLSRLDACLLADRQAD